jgi:nucleotide-binding universal stress UspA family protein
MFGDDRVILAATDFSETSDAVVAYAARLAEQLDRTLMILHAVQAPDPADQARPLAALVRNASNAITAQAEAVLQARPRLDVCTGVIVGSHAEVIATQARDAFVAVVGTGHHSTGASAHLSDRLPCPLVVVPSESSAARPELVASGRP